MGRELIDNYLIIKVGDLYLENIKVREQDKKFIIRSVSFIPKDNKAIAKYDLELPHNGEWYIEENKNMREAVLRVVMALQSNGFSNVEVIEEKIYREIEDRKLELKATINGLELK